MRQSPSAAAATVLALLASSAHAFVAPTTTTSNAGSSSTTQLFNTGGWGIGPQRNLTPEEFAKGGDRRAFEGYKLRDRGEFMRQVAKDKQDLERGEIDELLAVAQQAGIKVKDPAERLNKFELEGDDDDDDDELDLSVQWDDSDDVSSSDRTNDSITRLDEDTGASGVW